MSVSRRAVTVEATLLIAMFAIIWLGDVSVGGVFLSGAATMESSGIGPQHVVIITLLVLLGVFFAIATRAAFSAMAASRVELAPLILRQGGDIPPIRPPSPPKAPIANRLGGALRAQGEATRTLGSVLARGLRGEMPDSVEVMSSRVASSRSVPKSPATQMDVDEGEDDLPMAPRAPAPRAPAKDTRTEPVVTKSSVTKQPAQKPTVIQPASKPDVSKSSKNQKQDETPSRPSEGLFSLWFGKKSQESRIEDDLEALNRRIKKHVDGLYR